MFVHGTTLGNNGLWQVSDGRVASGCILQKSVVEIVASTPPQSHSAHM